MPGALPGDERARRLKSRLDSIVNVLEKGPATAKQISDETGIDQSTIHRLCRNFLILRGQVSTEKTRGDLARVYFLKQNK